MPARLLLHGGQVARHVDQGDDRDVEGVAEAHEAGRLHGGALSRVPAKTDGLVGHDAHRARRPGGRSR